MSGRSRMWILAASGLVLAQAAASLVLPHNFSLILLSDITQTLLLLSGALALLPNALATRGRTRLFWALMTLLLAFWLAYQLVWTYIDVFRRKPAPTPFGVHIVLSLHIP